MTLPSGAAAEVFSVREIATAAGVSVRDVQVVTGHGQIGSADEFLSATEAVRCVKLLRAGGALWHEKPLFAPPPSGGRSAAAGVAGASAIHAGMLALLVVVTTLGVASQESRRQASVDPARLVFLATPGPGGGGGGGGLRHPAPPPKAKMKTAAKVKSPVPPPKRLTSRKLAPRRTPPPPVAPRPMPRPVDPPPPAPRPDMTTQVVAPVVTASSDSRDRAGVLSDGGGESETQGSGSGGGVGTGQGTGIGEGTGAGIGPGSGGGTGGGPYRPGSGITPPELLREVRPEYTDDARRSGITGDVVLEVVVRRDGSVGDVKVLQGLGGGLDRRAIDAVKLWRFSPALRYGTPVDVLVEVAVEFKLR